MQQTKQPISSDPLLPLQIGPLSVWPPVVLAPMAGITNAPFRQLCREYGAGLYISEMVTSRLLLADHRKTLRIAEFAPDEKPRSIQLYGVDPRYLGEAVALLVGEDRVDHIDLNFGCPVRKVTRRGGGAAIPLKHNLFRNLVRAAVSHAGSVPVTVKFRVGLDNRYTTFLLAGRIAEEEGCAAVALHARTALQYYDGLADWNRIAELKAQVKHIPVLGNGDIWLAKDALRMMRQTGCDGVVVGRGCLGRPWLFRDLVDIFEGRSLQKPPGLLEVARILWRHAMLLQNWVGEHTAMLMLRKHSGWYLQGFGSMPGLRQQLQQVTSIAQLEVALASITADEDYPVAAAAQPRGKSGRQTSVALPAGYLDNPDDETPPSAAAEDPSSGG